MNKNLVRQAVVVVAVVTTIIVNGLANALPLNDQTTGAISDRFHVYFVPAGYVFSIWGLIYIGLIFFCVFQALPAQRGNPRLIRIGYLFTLSCAANIVWLFLWHFEYFPLTLVAMSVLLLSLISIYLRLGIGHVANTTAERWFVVVPFSIYLGWITVATIANATDVLDFLKWDGWGLSAEVWTVIMLLAATAISAAVAITRRDVAFATVIAWAFAGIAVKQANTPVVATAAWVAATLVVLALVAGVTLSRRSRLDSAGAG
jgi:hypothetical protein